MNAIEHLQETAWTKPQDYFGFSPEGDYVLATRHRDSDVLTRSNWDCLVSDFGAEAWDNGADGYNDRPTVYHWRASHCLVGWVEYLMVRSDAPEELLTRAGEAICALSDYPVWNEEHFCNLEMKEAEENWKCLDLRGRLEIIEGAHYEGKPISRFAIRRDYPPADDNGYISEQLR